MGECGSTFFPWLSVFFSFLSLFSFLPRSVLFFSLFFFLFSSFPIIEHGGCCFLFFGVSLVRTVVHADGRSCGSLPREGGGASWPSFRTRLRVVFLPFGRGEGNKKARGTTTRPVEEGRLEWLITDPRERRWKKTIATASQKKQCRALSNGRRREEEPLPEKDLNHPSAFLSRQVFSSLRMDPWWWYDAGDAEAFYSFLFFFRIVFVFRIPTRGKTWTTAPSKDLSSQATSEVVDARTA